MSIFCNLIDGWSKKGTSNFKLREYNALPEEGRTEKLVVFFFSLHKVAIFRQFLKFTNRRERERERKVLRHLVLFKHVRKSSLHTEH